MGTRADFYVGDGPKAEWLGSVAWDGYEWAEDSPNPLESAKTEQQFRDAVAAIAYERDDFTDPSSGWPWPWDDSRLTDYVYFWKEGKTNWEGWEGDMPDMSVRRNMAVGHKSGLITISAPLPEKE